jgi:hypothetical protein
MCGDGLLHRRARRSVAEASAAERRRARQRQRALKGGGGPAVEDPRGGSGRRS